MPAMASRSGTRRRSMNEINMVPFIDVMLVLLIIFMVTAPMLTPSSVNLPSVGKGANMPKKRADVIVDKDGGVRFKADGNERSVPLAQLGSTAKTWLKDQPADTPVLISADKTASYDSVMKAMSELQKAGVARVALAVKSGG
ncbi:MAG: ExbD/TolR family protein [Proteobacteria bacterium]|nr:ExbD/TolR family protein [Pseudomonadota bacterium]